MAHADLDRLADYPAANEDYVALQQDLVVDCPGNYTFSYVSPLSGYLPLPQHQHSSSLASTTKVLPDQTMIAASKAAWSTSLEAV